MDMKQRESLKNLFARHRTAAALVGACAILLCGFIAGWLIRGNADTTPVSHALRLSGYEFINPLLLCNISNQNPILEDKSLEEKVQKILDAHKSSGEISKASVYFIDPTSGMWATNYGNATFFPSSLGKIPIMITFYLQAESNPAILEKQVLFPAGSPDLNDSQDILPEKAILQGHVYTIKQLIEYMIKYSDNNATWLLGTQIDKALLDKVYGDLGIPENDSPNLQNLDFITTHQVATLFRVLYNATYLSRTDSANALSLLSQSSFTQGIVAGVASSTVVSHKLGLVGIAPNNITTEHELHDCGVVYGKDAYVLCVMTRGTAPLSTLESIISQVSASVFTDVQARHS
jgi:beta-lactamase class A